MLISTLPYPAGAFIVAVALLLAALVTAGAAILPPAAIGGPAAVRVDLRRLWLYGGGLLAVAAAVVWAGGRLGDSAGRPMTLTLGDVALMEREFRYREQVYERRLALLAETYRLDRAQMQDRYETELALLRERYDDAWQGLTRNNEALVRRIAVDFGLDADFLARIAAVESGFDSTVANPESGARGLFQFMPTTWNAVGARFAERLSEAGVVYAPVDGGNRGTAADPRNDARLNAVMGALLTRYNIGLTDSDDPAIVYLAHFAGPQMARHVRDGLESDPDQPIRDVVRAIMPALAEAVIAQNAAAYAEDMTVQDFYRLAASRFEEIESVLVPEDDQAP